MKPDRWARIEALFNDALRLPEQQRSAFLEQASAGDSSLAREVESLLAHADGDGESFEVAVRKATAEAVSSGVSAPSLNKGEQLAHYRVIEKLGSGGMGEVYAAEDTKLHRRVAIKVLSPMLRADFERCQR